MIREDEAGAVVGAELDAFQVIKCKPGPFIGGTSNARGDHDGSSDPTTLFTVTGDVLVRVFGVCTTNITGQGTIEVGVAGNTAGLIAQVADTETIDVNDIWIDNSVAEVGIAALSNVPATSVIVNGLDIIETIGTANLTAGEIYYVCMWRPLTPGSSVVAA
jgi:hypothetical protein